VTLELETVILYQFAVFLSLCGVVD